MVVCSGNTCRSPYAAIILQDLLPEYTINSAGTKAMIGRDLSNNGQILVNEYAGQNKTSHKSTKLTRQMCEAADIILVMENKHAGYIGKISPNSASNIFKYTQWYDKTQIADPFNKDLDVYRQCFKTISLASDAIKNQLKDITQSEFKILMDR